ncbi:hypothetical protein [Agrobacterium tumefaciens]|uniref:hypothetical protein n=1 Tax=Agrobacterium tumefaciens TaxID=358 RepID=UPI0021D3775C|nr:hypothetical protein [Agrobacterium tumefaciens]UXS23127.1 hypothetical protein FY153_01175 [Agrobacterium tumefaciens]
MFSVEETTFLEAEVCYIWRLQQDLAEVKRCFCRTGEGSTEIREELEDIISVSESPIIKKRAQAVIDEIDRHWPPLVRYA